MKQTPVNNLFKQLLARKQAAKSLGTIADRNLMKQFTPGEKAQPIIRRGGRNGSGKP